VGCDADEVEYRLMKAYAINLARSRDRRAHITAELDKTRLPYEIVEGVDWRDTDLSDARLLDPAFMALSTTPPGGAAAVLSHLAVYRRVLEDGLESALVVEDDVVLPADLPALLDAIAPQVGGAEVVLLNFHCDDPPCQVLKVGSIPLPSSRLLAQVAGNSFLTSGACYVITREACERRVKTGLPVRSHADEWPTHYSEGAIDRVRCVLPMSVVNSVKFRTTIDYYQPGSLQARIREAVANVKVPILYQALALRRRWNHRRAGRTGWTEFVDEIPGEELPSLLWRNPHTMSHDSLYVWALRASEHSIPRHSKTFLK
jgi:glycosyl transferase family 25